MADPEESDQMLYSVLFHSTMQLTSQRKKMTWLKLQFNWRPKCWNESDRAVAAQLEEVVGNFQPDQAILVTDGAEDESVLP